MWHKETHDPTITLPHIPRKTIDVYLAEGAAGRGHLEYIYDDRLHDWATDEDIQQAKLLHAPYSANYYQHLIAALTLCPVTAGRVVSAVNASTMYGVHMIGYRKSRDKQPIYKRNP